MNTRGHELADLRSLDRMACEQLKGQCTLVHKHRVPGMKLHPYMCTERLQRWLLHPIIGVYPHRVWTKNTRVHTGNRRSCRTGRAVYYQLCPRPESGEFLWIENASGQ